MERGQGQVKHKESDGVSFEQAAQVFFDPFVQYLDASRNSEKREGASFQPARPSLKKGNVMKLETIKKRLSKDRPMVSVTLRMPEGVVNDLKKVAPLKGFSGYQGLLRAYVGAGLREDLERMEGSAVAQLIEKLRADGVPEAKLNKAVSSLKLAA